ncbi:hypothetical protein D3C85_1936400 [compost metagenome]
MKGVLDGRCRTQKRIQVLVCLGMIHLLGEEGLLMAQQRLVVNVWSGVLADEVAEVFDVF